MIDLATIPEFVEGGVVAAISVVLVLLYLRSLNIRLMENNQDLGTELTITSNFRVFVAVGIASSCITSVAILKMGFAGTTSELLFAITLALLVTLFVVFLATAAFLTSIHINGDMVITHSPLGRKQVHLGSLTSIRINDRFQFELSDANGTIRFCHYVDGKRALIEHIIKSAPSNTTWELRELLREYLGSV
jgi:hypothetical protein